MAFLQYKKNQTYLLWNVKLLLLLLLDFRNHWRRFAGRDRGRREQQGRQGRWRRGHRRCGRAGALISGHLRRGRCWEGTAGAGQPGEEAALQALKPTVLVVLKA